MQDINAEASRAFADAIELVIKHYGLGVHQRAAWALLIYPDEHEPHDINVITTGKPSQVAHALLAAREQMLGGR
jgi:hypothetical protein